MLGKKLINSGPISSGANTFASENFNTVIYTGNGNNQRIGGYINRGAVFNGSNSYVDLGNTIATSTRAISIWVNADDFSERWPFQQGDGQGIENYIRFYNTDDIQVRWGNVTQTFSGYSANTWYHIVAQKDENNNANVWINGVEMGSTGSPSAITVNKTNIGRRYNFSSYQYYFKGKIDQLRIFNKALSQSEVATLYGETFASTTKSTTDIFEDNSAIALYQFEGNANATSGDLTHWAIVSDAGGNNMSCRLNSVSSEFTYTAPSGYSDWGGAWDTTSEVNTGGGSFSYSENNKKINESGGFYSAVKTVNGHKTGKYYFEVEYLSADLVVGLTRETTISAPFNNNAFKENAILRYTWTNTLSAYSTTNQTVGSAASVNDVYGFAVNFTDKEVKIYKNNTLITTQDLLPTIFNGTAGNLTYQEDTRFQPDLVWIKSRSTAKGHIISDSVTNDGTSNSLPFLSSHLTDRQYTGSEAGGNYIRNLNSNGFTVGSSLFTGSNGTNFVAWCFNAGDGNAVNNTDGSVASTVKANTAAGFSIVKFNGASGASTCGHGLSQAPELFIMKSLNVSGTWGVYVKNLGANKYLTLNDSVAQATSTTAWNNTHPTSTLLHWQGGIVAGGAGYTNVAYCFHSVTGYQKIGSYTGTGAAGNIVETGFEPAFLMIKIATANDSWFMVDNKRETTNPRGDRLFANSSAAEASEPGAQVNFLANGFEITGSGGGMGQTNSSGATYVYIAIAADPDQTDPTVENSFSNILWSGTGSARSITGLGFKPDLVWWKARNASNYNWKAIDSINGPTKNLYNNLTNSLATDVATTSFDDDGFTFGSGGNGNVSGLNYAGYAWKAGDHDDSIPQINTEGNIQSVVSVNDAAGFSILKYTGNEQASQTVGHGLSSSPEIAIVKQLDGGRDWTVLLFTQTSGDYMHLNSSQAESTDTNKWSAVSSTTFTVGADPYTNGAGSPYIAYLWYSVAGHSKIGYYSGNGYSGNQITGLGFSPKFLMIKRTDSAGGWRVQDTSRLGSSGTQKNVLEVNDVAAEQSNYVDISFDTNGFTLNTTAGDYNASGTNNYLYMAFK